MIEQHTAPKINLFKLLWVRRNLILGVFLLCCILSAFLLSTIPRYYTATAVISFEESDQNINTIQSAADLKPLSQIFKDEEALIRSEDILFPVIERLNLAQRPELNPEADPKKSKMYLLGLWYNSMMKIPNPDFTKNPVLSDELNQNISISIVDQKEIHITFACISPYLARSVVNTLANVYLEHTSPLIIKKLVSNTKELPNIITIPDIYHKSMIALYISVLISLLIGITTPLPKNESAPHAS